MAEEDSRGDWRGSSVTTKLIDHYREQGFLGSAEEVEARAPSPEEISPVPRPGEIVIFTSHLDRGLALPTSIFFDQFLCFYGIQPHHVGANSVAQLSSFVVLYEGYLGIRPTLDLFVRQYYLSVRYKSAKEKGKAKSTEPHVLVECGCAVVYRRPGCPLPASQLPDTVMNCQMSFFYVKNVKDDVDRTVLPTYSRAAPSSRNWTSQDRGPSEQVGLMSTASWSSWGTTTR